MRLLPPSSSETDLPFDSPAYRKNRRPTETEPVNVILSTNKWRPSGSPASSPNPGTTLSTPLGSPASAANSASASAVSGDCSAGFNTTELPVAKEGASFHAVMISG